MGPVTARIPERNTGDFHILCHFSLSHSQRRGMLSSATSKLEGHNKDGGMNIMEKITISGLRNNVMENNIELMVLL